MQNYKPVLGSLNKVNNTNIDTTKSLSSDFSMSNNSYTDSGKEDYIIDDTSRNVVTEDYNPISVPDGCKTIISDSNDTFASIAKEYGISEEELWNLNSDHLSDRDIGEDVELVVPIKDNNGKKAGSKSGGGSGSGEGTGSQGGSGSGGGNSSDISPSNKEYEKITLEKAKSKLAEIFNKYGLTGSSFTKIYDFVEKNAQENGIPFNTNAEKAAAIDAYIKGHDEYQDMDIEDLEGLVLSYDMVKEMEPDYLENESASNDIDASKYYEDIINELVLSLGYKESELDEFTTFDMLEIINDNKDKVSSLLNEELLLPSEIKLEDILSSYLINHFMNILPQDDNFDYEELLETYQSEAIDILIAIGVSDEELYDMNTYELVNLLYEKEGDIHKWLSNQGLDMFDYKYGFNELFTIAMDSIAFSKAESSKEELEKYINANNFPEDIKQQSLDYYDDGNINSAMYTLKLELAQQKIEDYSDRIDDIKTELFEILSNSPLGGEFGRDIYTFVDELEEIYGESQDTIKAKQLLEELDICKGKKNQVSSQIYQLKMAIVENSFQYLDNERNTDEYKNAINNSNITADSELLREIEDILSQGKVINMNELNSNNQLSSTLFTIAGLINGYPGDYNDYEGLEVYLVTDDDISHSTSSIESVEKTDNGIVVRVEDNGIFVNLKYNTSDGSVIYEFESDGEIVLTTDNPMDYNNINYFELFEYLKSKDEYKDMSKEEFLTTVFGWDSSDVLEYKDPFEMAELTYCYLEDDKIDDFNYLYEVEGIDRANEYLESLRNRLHNQMGMNAAIGDIELIMSGPHVACSALVGLNNGVEGWINNVYTFFTKDTTMTPTDYESQYLLSLFSHYAERIDFNKGDLDSEAIEKIKGIEGATYLDYYYATGDITEEQYNNLKTNEYYQEFVQYTEEHPKMFQLSYSVGQNVGNMLPSVIGSALAAPLGGVAIAGHFVGAGQAVAGALMYAGAYGGTYKETINSGAREGTAMLYSTLSALSEVTTEYFLGRIPGVARLSNAVNPVIAQNLAQMLAIRGINLLKDIGGELVEESLQIWIDYALNQMVLGEDIDLSGWPEEELDTIIVTTFTTLILGLPSNIATLTNDMSNGPVIKLKDGNIELSFKQLYELNQKYVNSETGQIDIEGLLDEIHRIYEEYSSKNKEEDSSQVQNHVREEEKLMDTLKEYGIDEDSINVIENNLFDLDKSRILSVLESVVNNSNLSDVEKAERIQKIAYFFSDSSSVEFFKNGNEWIEYVFENSSLEDSINCYDLLERILTSETDVSDLLSSLKQEIKNSAEIKQACIESLKGLFLTEDGKNMAINKHLLDDYIAPNNPDGSVRTIDESIAAINSMIDSVVEEYLTSSNIEDLMNTEIFETRVMNEVLVRLMNNDKTSNINDAQVFAMVSLSSIINYAWNSIPSGFFPSSINFEQFYLETLKHLLSFEEKNNGTLKGGHVVNPALLYTLLIHNGTLSPTDIENVYEVLDKNTGDKLKDDVTTLVPTEDYGSFRAYLKYLSDTMVRMYSSYYETDSNGNLMVDSNGKLIKRYTDKAYGYAFEVPYIDANGEVQSLYYVVGFDRGNSGKMNTMYLVTQDQYLEAVARNFDRNQIDESKYSPPPPVTVTSVCEVSYVDDEGNTCVQYYKCKYKVTASNNGQINVTRIDNNAMNVITEAEASSFASTSDGVNNCYSQVDLTGDNQYKI